MKNIGILLFINFIAISLVSAQSKTQWRGLDRSGHCPDQQLADSWPENGPELLLHVENLPDSYSSAVFADETIYTTGIFDEKEFITAIDLNGTILCNTNYRDAWMNSYPQARCTTTIEG